MINRAEPHALEAALCHPVPKSSCGIRLQRIEQSVCDEPLWILMQRIVDVRVVPAKKARIDEHGVLQAKLIHLRNLVFDWSFDGNAFQVRPFRVMERELRIEGPDL